MRGLPMASLLVLAAVSAVTGPVAAVATTIGKGASTCAVESPSDDEAAPAVYQHAVLKKPQRRLLP